MIEMKVAAIALDAITRSPIVLLKDASERRALPIYIGQDQARSIINALEQQPVLAANFNILPFETSTLQLRELFTTS